MLESFVKAQIKFGVIEKHVQSIIERYEAQSQYDVPEYLKRYKILSVWSNESPRPKLPFWSRVTLSQPTFSLKFEDLGHS